MKMKGKSEEYRRFDSLMQELVKVPHGKLKAALDAERAEKAEKRKAKASASGRASRAKD